MNGSIVIETTHERRGRHPEEEVPRWALALHRSRALDWRKPAVAQRPRHNPRLVPFLDAGHRPVRPLEAALRLLRTAE